MNLIKTIIFSALIGITGTACSQMSEQQTPATVIQQLTGTWISEDHKGKAIFYPDETAKLVFPEHRPPIKLISTYDTIKDKKLGISLGGFWSGPAMLDTSLLQQEKRLTLTFPDEAPITLLKAEP